MSKKNKIDKYDWEEVIIALAQKDDEFKQALLEDTNKALKKLKCPLTSKLQVRCVQEGLNEWIICIPPAPNNSKALSEMELKLIAGGCGYGFSYVLPDA